MYRFYDKKIENPNAGYTKHVIFMFYEKERKPVSAITLVKFKKDLTDWIMISELQTADEYEGRGFATKLLNSSLKKLKEDHPDKNNFLVVYPDTDMVSFYESFEFHTVPGILLHDMFPFMVYGYPTPERMSQLEAYGIQAADAILDIPQLHGTRSDSGNQKSI